jgi:DNA-binding LacI/PurR family transcriptional regulator
MKPFFPRSTSAQLADHLRREILSGAFGGTMPGIKRLVRGLGVNSSAVSDALKQLEAAGILAGQGPRRRHRIVAGNTAAPPAMRIAILAFDPAFKSDSLGLETLRHLLENGHGAFFARKTLTELRMDPRRVARLVERTKADAWIVNAGLRPVLEWFAGSGLPTFALYGARTELPIAWIAPAYPLVVLDLTRRLIGMGHRRIVFLLNRGQLDIGTARVAPMLLAEMERQGIPTGSYNVPKWEDTPEGFHCLLDSLFKHSPPTALLIEEVPHLVATLQFCGLHGIRVPQDLSLACLEHRFDLDYCLPAVTHIRWDEAPIVRRIAHWANAVARGKTDHRKGFTKAELVEGATIAPAAARQ